MILRDAMYPPERVLFVNHVFNSKLRRESVKRWRLDFGLKSDRFASDIVERYYRSDSVKVAGGDACEQGLR